MRQIILTEILVLFSNAAICNKNYKSVCLVIMIIICIMYLGIQIWNVFGHGSHLHFFVVVDDVVLRCRCRWWFIKSCHLHISVTQEWLFGELETKFHFSEDCLRVEGTHTRPLVRLVVVRCQNCTLTAAKPRPGLCEDDIPKNDFNTSTSKPTWSVPTTF